MSFTLLNGAATQRERMSAAKEALYRWVAAREAEHARLMASDALALDHTFYSRSSRFVRYAKLTTEFCASRYFDAWALEYSRALPDLTSVRQTVGLRTFADGETLLVYLRDTIEVPTEYLMSHDALPSVDPRTLDTLTPKFFMDALAPARVRSGNVEVTSAMMEAKLIDTERRATNFAAYLKHESRLLAVALFAGATPEHLAHASRLVSEARGRIVVCCVDERYVERFAEYFDGKNFVLSLPFVTGNSIYGKLHLDTRAVDFEADARKLWRAVMQHPIQEGGAVSSVENIHYLIDRERFSATRRGPSTRSAGKIFENYPLTGGGVESGIMYRVMGRNGFLRHIQKRNGVIHGTQNSFVFRRGHRARGFIHK